MDRHLTHNFFDPVPLTPYPFPGRCNELIDKNEIQDKEEWKTQLKNEKEQIKKRYTRILEKIKEIKQQFLHTVTSGRRSEEVILEFYDELVQIWGGSPTTKPFQCGTSREFVNSTQNESDRNDNDNDDGQGESSRNGNRDLGTSTSTHSATESKKTFRKKNFSEQKSVLKLIGDKQWLYKSNLRHTLKSEIIYGNWKPFKNDEKCFLFHLEISSHSQDV